MALAWAVLVCLTAIQFVGAPGSGESGAADAQADAANVNAAIAALN